MYLLCLNTITIDINANLKNINDTLKNGAILYTLSHELTHIAEHATDEYVELRTAVQEVIGADNWDTMVQKHLSVLQETQPDEYNSMSETERTEYASKEALAEACSDMLKDSDILIKMAEDNPSLGKKIINTIKKLITRIRNRLANNSEVQAKDAKLLKVCADDLQSIVDKWEKAVIEGIKNQNAKHAVNDNSAQKQQKNNTANNDGVEYQIRYTTENMPVVVIEDNILQDVPKSQWVKTVKNVMSTKFADGIPVKGRLVKVNQRSRNEFTNSKNSKYLRDNQGNIYTDKLKSANNLDEIVLASTNYVNEDLKHQRKDKFNEFARGEVLLQIKNNQYKAKVIIGFTSSNEMVLYDVIDFNSVNFALKKESTPYRREPVRSGVLSTNNISQNDTTVNNQSMPNNKNNSTQFQARDTYVDYTNTDLSTLDDKQLKVYNKRGWANALFTDEDRKLLNEKYNELNKRTKQRTDNVLGDGSRVVEVNNKLVLIGGTFEEPIIHNVLAINADNETEAEIYKELILDDIQEYGHTKQEYIDKIKAYELYSTEETFRNYESADFNYHKGRKDSGARAVLPDSFKSYGYTKQFQDGRGDSSETEQGISDEVEYQPRGLAMSDSELLANAEDTVNAKPTFDLSDDFTFDDDLFDFEDESRKIEFDKLVNKIFHFLIQFYSIIKNLFVKLIQRGDFYVK